jgi:hypothetical protein
MYKLDNVLYTSPYLQRNNDPLLYFISFNIIEEEKPTLKKLIAFSNF